MSRKKAEAAAENNSDGTATEHLERIRSAEKKVMRSELSVGDLQQRMKDAKADLKAAQKELREEIRDNQARLVFKS